MPTTALIIATTPKSWGVSRRASTSSAARLVACTPTPPATLHSVERTDLRPRSWRAPRSLNQSNAGSGIGTRVRPRSRGARSCVQHPGVRRAAQCERQLVEIADQVADRLRVHLPQAYF